MNMQFRAENDLTYTVPLIERYMGVMFAFSSLLSELNLMIAADTSDIADAGYVIDAPSKYQLI